MSNIEPNIIDPARPPMPPDDMPPTIDPSDDELVDSDDIREPGNGDIRPIEPDPEEGGNRSPSIRT